MHLMTRRLFQIGAGLFALSLPLLCQTTCTAPTPEPATFWLLGGGAGAILLLRRLRSKK